MENYNSLAMIAYPVLQNYWWFIVSIMAGLLVFLLFVQGGQTLLYQLADDEDQRKLLVNSLGRKWELTFTMLVVFGGTIFASFPLFYSTSFGGAYWAWMTLLFSFIIQAVSYEFRSKPNNVFGHKTYEGFLFINGALGTFLLGVIVATLFTGSEFTVDVYNISNLSNPVISQWGNKWHGLEALVNGWNVLFGMSIVFLSRVLGILYFMNSINHKEILSKAKKQLLYNAVPFVVSFLIFVFYVVMKDGLLYDTQMHRVFFAENKYWHNVLEMPLNTFVFVAGVLLTLTGIVWTYINDFRKGIWFSGIGVIMVGFSLFSLAGFNNTAFYPSTIDMQSSLTIYTASSSYYTLNTMAYVSAFVPVVIAYICYVWYKMNNKPIDKEELNNETHVY